MEVHKETSTQYPESNLPFPTKYPGFWSKTSQIQLLYSLWVNMGMIGVGLAFGFSSVTVIQFSRDQWMGVTPTHDEIATVASSLTMAAPIGCVICGLAMDKFGRRAMLISSLLPMMIGWTYTGLARHPLDLIIGRVITGIGVGMATSPPRVFTTEITLPNMRAAVGGITSMAIALGMTIQACLGFLLYWRYLCLACGGYCLIIMFLNCYLPESPYFVLMKSTVEDAKNVLCKFRSSSYNMTNEITLLKDFKIMNSIRRLGLQDTLKALLRPSACKPFCIVIGYLLTVQLAGNAVMSFWTVDILKSSGGTIDPYLGNVMLNTIRFISCIGVAVLLFWVTIRPMALISCVGVGSACIGLSMEYLNKGENTAPVIPAEVGFIFYIVFDSVSFHSLPLTLLFEILPLQIRGVLGGIATGTLFSMMCVTCAAYPYLKDLCGFGYTFLLYGICSLLGCVGMFFFLPETKGLTLQEIEEYYNDLRTTLTSQQQVISVQKLPMLESGNIPKRPKVHRAENTKKDGSTGMVNELNEKSSVGSNKSERVRIANMAL